MTIWRCFACWTSKATHTQAPMRPHLYQQNHPHPPPSKHTHTQICNTCCFSTSTMFSSTRLNVTSHMHCLSCGTIRHVVINSLVQSPALQDTTCSPAKKMRYLSRNQKRSLSSSQQNVTKVSREMVNAAHTASSQHILFL